MADVDGTTLVSCEALPKEMRVNDVLRNETSNELEVNVTECSTPNPTNTCSNRNGHCGDAKENGYKEIDSFSELSFQTNDEISLQDLMESEFTARISTMNEDEPDSQYTDDRLIGQGVNAIHDPFDVLFDDFDNKAKRKNPAEYCRRDGIPKNGSKESENGGKEVGNPGREVAANLDDFVGGPMHGDTSVITADYLNEYLEVEGGKGAAESTRKSVNIFKLNGRGEMPMTTYFDPFSAIEEDSDSSNTAATKANELYTPDEFPFPDSPEQAKSLSKADDVAGVITEVAESPNNGSIDVNKSDDVMREFFCKRVSDENLEFFTEQNYGQNGDENESKFRVAGSMGNVETANSLPSEKINVEEFYSSEDILQSNEDTPAKSGQEGDYETPVNEVEDNVEVLELFPPFCKMEFMDVDGFQDECFSEKPFPEEDNWTTVGEVLNAQTDISNPEEDPCFVSVTNVCSKTNSYLKTRIKDSFGNVGPADQSTNEFPVTDSETEMKSETSEKKTIKKKKSKKGKKSDEKENISVLEHGTKSVTDSDDLCNVSVKNLMLTYSSEMPKSIESRRYKQTTEPGLKVHNLKARSMVDLTSSSKKVAALRSDLFPESKSFETSKSTTNLCAGERHPVVTGISVQALKSSFSKFDQLSKKTILHVRSVDAGKAQKQFNEAATGISEITCNCKSCGKPVFQMEQVKAEKSVWHKNCFRCKECNKQLSVDTYSSNEGILYCKPHFKELFKPKAILEDDSEPVKLKKPELIVRENEPVELPPEVVRASDKPDLGLAELASLNVKSRYQVFEKGEELNNELLEKSPSCVSVKRSPSILSKLAKFQKKGIDVGVRDEELHGLPLEESSSSSEDEDEEEEGDKRTAPDESSPKKIVKSKKAKERPISFSKMGDVKSVWENGIAKTREEMREERKAEIHQIRSKLFMGKQVKMKEAYEQAVRESENLSPKKTVDVRCEKAKSIKECFEKGEPLNVDDEHDGEDAKKKLVDDDRSLFEAGISKKSRSLFLELDKSAKMQGTAHMKKATGPQSPSSSSPRPREVTSRTGDLDIVKSSDAVEDVQIETADISSKFKFFESYKEPEREKKKFRITPPREGQIKGESPEKEIERDPNVVRASDKVESEILRTNTTTKMLSLFRQMEEKTEEIPEGPKPLKRFTPPPDYKGDSEGESGGTDESEGDGEEEGEEEGESTPFNPNLIRSSDRVEDEYLKQAANAARAKQLRAKFERWEEREKEKERKEMAQRKVNGFSTNETSTENSENIEVTSIECTKSLRARFESMKGGEVDNPKEKVARPKVNRFVEIQNNMAELCDVCRCRVYQLEKVETSGKIFHKACFRCMQCNCLLRMESFTLNCGHLYCLPHFKQKFISKGNYDEGFGVDQHKAKWSTVTSY